LSSSTIMSFSSVSTVIYINSRGGRGECRG
jgi:hypothetical protein